MLKLAIVAEFDGTHIGGSLARGAAGLGIAALTLDTREAACESRFLRSFLWRFTDRRPLGMERFSQTVIAACAEARPDILVVTGAVPPAKSTLRRLRSMGIVCVNYSSDDPSNLALCAKKHPRALREYDVVFSPRRANLEDLKRLGCPDVHYLPSGCDEWLSPIAEEISNAPTTSSAAVTGIVSHS